MEKTKFHVNLSTYRYEFLLIALLLLIFDKIFFPDNDFYIKYVWFFNMLVIAIASYGIFSGHNKIVLYLRNIMGLISIAMPFLFLALNGNESFLMFLTVFFILYYFYIFGVVMYQISLTKEVKLNILIGSFCGYLLLSMVALFSYLFLEILNSKSFHGIDYYNLPVVYNQLSYFSFITLTSIGFGDIYPITDTSRLTVAFFGMAGQFYMVAVVGIIISKFTTAGD